MWLSILLCVMSVGYALLGQTLTINGTANLKAGSWSVHFDSTTLSEVTTTGVVPEGTISTNVTDFSFSLAARLQSSPDGIEYSLDVVNDGTIDAKADTIDFYINNVKQNTENITTLSNGYSITDGIVTFTLTGIKQNDVIVKDTSKTITVNMENTSTSLPAFPDANEDGTNEDYVTDFEVRMNYVQN